MQTAPPNKMGVTPAAKGDRWPRAKPAHDAYERACEVATFAEARDRADSPQVIAARAAVAAANDAYKAAVLADESEQFRQEKAVAGPGKPRIKCACGSWLDPEVDGPRCPDCDRKISAVVRR